MVSCGVGCSCGSDPELLWLWCRGRRYSSDWTPSLGTSMCRGCGAKKTKKKKKKKIKKKKKKKPREQKGIDYNNKIQIRAGARKQAGVGVCSKSALEGPAKEVAFEWRPGGRGVESSDDQVEKGANGRPPPSGCPELCFLPSLRLSVKLGPRGSLPSVPSFRILGSGLPFLHSSSHSPSLSLPPPRAQGVNYISPCVTFPSNPRWSGSPGVRTLGPAPCSSPSTWYSAWPLPIYQM